MSNGPVMTRGATRTTLNPNALAAALTNAIKDALNSGDTGKMVAVEKIVAKEAGSVGLDGLLRTIAHDPVDFLMVASPGFDKELKQITGRNRARWLVYVS